MENPEEILSNEVNRLGMIADFMKASSEIERYLQEGHPLDGVQYDSITTTIDSLQVVLKAWKRKTLSTG